MQRLPFRYWHNKLALFSVHILLVGIASRSITAFPSAFAMLSACCREGRQLRLGLRPTSLFAGSTSYLSQRRRKGCVSVSVTLSLRDEMDNLESEIARLHGHKINVNSPKQVATAIFGRMQSTNRTILQKAAEGRVENLSPTQRQIAALVLNHRELSRGPVQEPAPIIQTPPNGVQALELTTPSEKENALNPVIQSTDENGRDQSLDDSSVQSDYYLSSYDRQVEALFAASKSKIHSFWKDHLLQVTRPTARALVYQLDSHLCPMGFNPLAAPRDPLRRFGDVASTAATTTTAGMKGSFLAYCRDQKQKYPDAIVLTRCGDFYETFGVDAIMLVEHCGLNSMGGKAKAGCPIRNVQATLDCLTAQGFRVAVYEEAADTDALAARASGGSKSRIKNRLLAQIVSAASPTYLYDLVLLGNPDSLMTAPPSRPYVGVLSLASGYTIVEISLEEQSVRVSERNTAESVACRLAAYPPCDPLFYVPSMSEYETTTDGVYSLPFLPSRRESSGAGPGGRLRTKVIPPSLMQDARPGVSDDDCAKKTILSALFRLVGSREEQKGPTVDDFVLLPSTTNAWNATQTNPLYLETSTQLGLMHDRAIPSLVSYLLPESAPASSRRFLRRFLLTPPPPNVAQAMHELVAFLKDSGPAFPALTVPPIGKILALIRAGQASAEVYGDVLHALTGTILVLENYGKESPVVKSLMTLLEHESGLAADAESLHRRCSEAIHVIEEVINPVHHSRSSQDPSESERISSFGNLIPEAFFERNEATWRGRIRREASPASYDRVEKAAETLAAAVATDFWGTPLHESVSRSSESKSPIVQDIFNNLFALREVPRHADDEGSKSRFIHPHDRFGKVLRNRYTTEAVQEALSDYVDACEKARLDVSSVLFRLSQRLHENGNVPAIVQASHANLVLSSAMYHAAKARSLGWNLANTYEQTDATTDSAGNFNSVWPYWMDRSEAVANSFELSGMWLLTAPNMAGKSTILRSTAAAALLSVCGLCAPVGPGSMVRRFDHIFVRGASSDVPSEQKSAFGAEMGDVAALLRCCGERSLVFVDELGRGTSPRDGTRLAAAVLEEMSSQFMSGIFATHLHDILDLPLQGSDRIVKKRMAIHDHDSTGKEIDLYTWTYRLEDGVCTDSMALVTALRFGLPQKVLDRAESFSAFLPHSGTIPATVQPPVNGVFREQEGGAHVRVNGRSPDAKVTSIVESLAGQTAHSIPPEWTVPPSLEGESCVYVMQLDNNDNSGQGYYYYVGETDNLRQRLKSHRSKGWHWANARTIAVPIPDGKSKARAIESRLIQRLARDGYHLESIWDGQHSTS